MSRKRSNLDLRGTADEGESVVGLGATKRADVEAFGGMLGALLTFDVEIDAQLF